MVRKALATALALGLSSAVTVACKSTDEAVTPQDVVAVDSETTTEVIEQGDTAEVIEENETVATIDESAAASDPAADKLAKAYADATDPEATEATETTEAEVIEAETTETEGTETEASETEATETEVIDEEASGQQADSAEAEGPEATDQEEDAEATDDEATTAACDRPILNKSGAAVAQPCLTSEDFMKSLDLSQEQIRRVELLSKTAGLAH